MRIALTSLLAVGLIGAVGCSNSTTGATSNSAPSNTATPGATDSSLKQAVQSKIASDPALGKVDVKADASKNEVTLSGTVTSESARSQAVDMAKSVPNVTVVDKIDVKPEEVSRNEYTPDMARQTRDKAKSMGDRIGNSLDDAWLYSKIETKLATNSETPARKINVDVSNHVVTLRGQVNSLTARQEVDKVVRDTDGVQGVRDLIKVKG